MLFPFYFILKLPPPIALIIVLFPSICAKAIKTYVIYSNHLSDKVHKVFNLFIDKLISNFVIQFSYMITPDFPDRSSPL